MAALRRALRIALRRWRFGYSRRRTTVIEVSNAQRIVYPDIGRTKGDVVAYYERVAPRALMHLADRPVSIRRFPKGISAPGFFQKHVPAHYPASISRFEVRRSKAAAKKHPHKGAANQEITAYPLLREAAHLAYLANQGAIELHVPTVRVQDVLRPDRLVVDLDPPAGALELVRRAAHLVRETLTRFGLETVPIATGSKGYHVVAAIRPTIDVETLAVSVQKLAALLTAAHPDELTTTFRIANRGQRVFVDWLRNFPNATVIAPYSLRARSRATVATPLRWDEIDATSPDAYTIDDLERLVERPDSLAELAKAPSDAAPFVAAVEAAFDASGLVIQPFDRFRS